METKRIEQLLEKYWEGETSIAEERELKDYFKRKDIPAHLKAYQAQFVYFNISTDVNESNADLETRILDAIESNLKTESNKIQPNLTVSHSSKNNLRIEMPIRWIVGVAASLVLFVAGFLLGRMGNNPQVSPDIAGIQKDLQETKRMVMLSMLKQNSASERIQGVNYVHEIKDTNPQIIEALIHTLNQDESTNVRMAAANALFTFKDEPKVRQAFIQSLQNQDDEAVQISLINMLIAMKEKKAVEPIKQIIADKPIPDKIKQKLERELNQL
jgi:HEAT repeats